MTHEGSKSGDGSGPARLGWGAAVVLWFAMLGAVAAAVLSGQSVRSTLGVFAVWGLAVVVVAIFKRRSSTEALRRHPGIIALSVLLPPLDRYLDEQQQREEDLAANRSLVAAMGHVLEANCLEPMPQAHVASMSLADRGEISLEELTEKIAPHVFPRSLHAGWTDEQCDLVLRLLYHDVFPSGGDSAMKWQRQREELAPLLSAVLVRTGHVLRTGASQPDVETQLGEMSSFSTDELLDRLSKVPVGVANRMESVFVMYRLPKWSAAEWMAIAAEVKTRAGDDVRNCAEVCARRIAPTSQKLTADLLHLIYLERFSPSTEGFWLERGEAVLSDLTTLLAGSPLLPRHAEAFTGPAMLRRLMTHHRFYSLTLLRAELDALQQLLTMVDRYATYLSDEGFDLKGLAPMSEQVIRSVEAATDGLPRTEYGVERIRRPQVAVDVLIDFGERAIRACCPQLPFATWPEQEITDPLFIADAKARLVASVGVAALHLFVRGGERGPEGARWAIARAARDLGSEEPALILAAHALWEDVRPEPARLRRVVEEWGDVLDTAQQADPLGFERRCRHAQQMLVEGALPATAPAGDGADAPGELVYRLEGIRDELVGLRHGLDPVRDGADEELLRPYLLTFDERRGPLADLLEVLTCPGDKQRTLLTDMGIRLQHGGVAKYRFANFTRQTRLGFLPRGMHYDQFLAELEIDLERLLVARVEVLRAGGLELVSPSGVVAIPLEGAPPLEITSGPGHGRVDLHGIRQAEYQPTEPRFRGVDRFTYTEMGGRHRTIRVLVQPDLAGFEVTLGSIRLSQFAELVFRTDDLRDRTRRMSILDVVDTLERRNQLDAIELAILRRHLGSITASHVA